MNLEDISYMHLAIEEARKGTGRTSPNPCVGAILVRDDMIVGRGFHRKAGTPHAEVNAIHDGGEKITGSTLYVTLEPCNHTGRTPPCTQTILDAGITRVVVGMPDPNPSVAGGGSAYLESQGIEVEQGVLLEECTALNYPFIKHVTTGLPWVVLKAGMSLDGKISYTSGQGGNITGSQAKRFTHELRNTLDAILIGIETALVDNPSLTTRLSSSDDVRDPLRIVLDTHLRLDPAAELLQQNSTAQTWVYCGPDVSEVKKNALEKAGGQVFSVALNDEDRLDLEEVLRHLGSKGITSVLVEGGAMIHGYLLKHNLVDEVFLLTAPFFIGDQGTQLISGYSCDKHEDSFPLQKVECSRLGEDVLVHGFMNIVEM